MKCVVFAESISVVHTTVNLDWNSDAYSIRYRHRYGE